MWRVRRAEDAWVREAALSLLLNHLVVFELEPRGHEPAAEEILAIQYTRARDESLIQRHPEVVLFLFFNISGTYHSGL